MDTHNALTPGPRYILNPVLEAMAKGPHLGAKTGRGFFRYDAKGKQGELDAEALKRLGMLQGDSKFSYDDVCAGLSPRGMAPARRAMGSLARAGGGPLRVGHGE